MKFVTWNVNGLRAALQKGFLDYFSECKADAFCIQETKMQPGQVEVDTPGYYQYWNSAEKKGYSGTAVFSRTEPLSVSNDFDVEEHSHEGRVLTLEYEKFFLVTAYSPNAQPELARIDYRMRWEDDFRAYADSLKEKKPVIICGDLNVARSPIDLRHPKANEGKAGYSPQERNKMEALLKSGFVDSFRLLYPDRTDAYTWWSYRFHARNTNAGWRIDYFLVSDAVKGQIKDNIIRSDIYGSDHCPVELTIF